MNRATAKKQLKDVCRNRRMLKNADHLDSSRECAANSAIWILPSKFVRNVASINIPGLGLLRNVGKGQEVLQCQRLELCSSGGTALRHHRKNHESSTNRARRTHRDWEGRDEVAVI